MSGCRLVSASGFPVITSALKNFWGGMHNEDVPLSSNVAVQLNAHISGISCRYVETNDFVVHTTLDLYVFTIIYKRPSNGVNIMAWL